MPSKLKSTVAVCITLSLMVSSCTTTRYHTQIAEVPDSRKLLHSYYNCTVHELPSANHTELVVSFEKAGQYELQEEKKEIQELDNRETRIAGWCTMLLGALFGGIVALGGTDDDGNTIDPNPEAGKGILIGSLILGGLMAIIPDSKKEISSTVTSRKYDEYEPIAPQDSLYAIWSSIYPENIIQRALVHEKLRVDVVADLGLDYVENQDSIQVYFKSNWDESLVYKVDFLASDYLIRYLNVKDLQDSISLYQAPTTQAPVIGHLSKGDHLEFIEVKEEWYKARWNQRQVYLKAEWVDYFFAVN